MPIANISREIQNVYIYASPALIPLTPDNRRCPPLVPCSFPEIGTRLGRGKVGDFCGYFGGDEAGV